MTNAKNDAGMSPSADRPKPIMKFFKYEHLPAHLQAISKPFCDMAAWMEKTLPENAEKGTALRKLLESKDAAVRAMLPEE